MRIACPTRTCAHILTHLVIAHETSCGSCGSWHLWQAAEVGRSPVTCAFLWAGFLLAPDGFASAVAHTRLGCGWQGAKRFTLLPPAAHRFVYLRPHHDPRRRHARAHFGSVRQPGETASFPTWHESRIETDTALRADLGARETPCTREAGRVASRVMPPAGRVAPGSWHGVVQVSLTKRGSHEGSRVMSHSEWKQENRTFSHPQN